MGAEESRTKGASLSNSSEAVDQSLKEKLKFKVKS